MELFNIKNTTDDRYYLASFLSYFNGFEEIIFVKTDIVLEEGRVDCNIKIINESHIDKIQEAYAYQYNDRLKELIQERKYRECNKVKVIKGMPIDRVYRVSTSIRRDEIIFTEKSSYEVPDGKIVLKFLKEDIVDAVNTFSHATKTFNETRDHDILTAASDFISNIIIKGYIGAVNEDYFTREFLERLNFYMNQALTNSVQNRFEDM